MPRFVAFLRGVGPLNAKMPDLKRCFESAGFTDVKTVLASGNVVFDARSSTLASLERRCEAQMQARLGASFFTIVRRVDMLRDLLDTDPYAGFGVAPDAKRVVSFLRAPAAPRIALPLRLGDAHVHGIVGTEVFTSYLPSQNDPVFMRLIEKAFGATVTTRTWDTIGKCAAA